MNRRNFLKLLGAAGAAVALPIALVPASEAPRRQSVALGEIEERVEHRIDLWGSPWGVHYHGLIGTVLYEYYMLVDHKPTKPELQKYRGYAVKAFQRAAKKQHQKGPNHG